MIENEKVTQPEMVTQGPGQMLKQARERANLSVQDMSERMKLKKTLILDIEQDSYDINLSLTFVRGYLKLYAKHVQLEESDVINAFENLNTQKTEPAKLQSFSRRIANQANDDKLMLVTYFIVAVVIALVVIWWFQQSSVLGEGSSATQFPKTAVQERSVDKEPSSVQGTLPELSEQKNVETEDASDIISLGNTPIEESALITPEVKTSATISSHSTDSSAIDNNDILAADQDIPEQSPLKMVEPVELIFEFSGDCWMNLSDATGENIAYGVKVKGRVMPVKGIPPFVVTLGAPEVVKIRYAGEPLDMSFLPKGRIAKFNLPLSE